MANPESTWRQLNLLARSYIDLQQTRIAAQHRLRKLTESSIIQAGAAKEIRETENNRTTVRIEITDKDVAEQVVLDLKKSKPYAALTRHHDTLAREEKDLLHDISQVAYEHPIWKWCENTKGLSDVAAMTLLGFINPETTPTVGHLWAFCGLTPESKMKKGEKASYNPLLKGRVHLLARNVIMAKDPYYYNLFRIKKDYLQARPDVEEKKGEKKGWAAWVNNMAKRWLVKLLLSHAYEIIMRSEGVNVKSEHHPHIPVKPDLPAEQDEVVHEFERYNHYLLEGQRKQFDRGLGIISTSHHDVGYKGK